MNRKLLVSVIALLIVGLVAVPLASAQFGGGDSDNNDDSTDSGSDDSTSDDTSSGSDSTDDSDSNYDGGGSTNNDNETSDTSDTSDNETTDDSSSYDGGDSENNDNETSGNETTYDGGDSENNENETNFDGGDSENNDNETNFDGGDSENNENETDTGGSNDTSEDDSSGSDDGSNDDETGGGNDDDESSSDDSGSSGGSSSSTFITVPSTDQSLEAEVNPDTIQIGESVTISGSLTGDGDLENQEIEILLNDETTTSTFTDSNGDFEAVVTPETTGENDITVTKEDLEEALSVHVTPTVSISSMHTSLETTPGESIDVCVDITSQTSAEVTLYHNEDTHDSENGKGEICFTPTLVEGENHFRAVASVEGDRDEAEITRNADSTNQQQQEEATSLGPSTGGFLTSTTSGIIAGLGIIAALGAVVAKRRGFNPVESLTG